MFKTYLKLAFRNILRNKVFSLINISGLAMGIVACITIFLITRYDFSFDRHHPDGDRIYRIVGNAHRSNGENIFINSIMPQVAAFEHVIPGFESQVGFHLVQAKVTVPGKDGSKKEFSERDQSTNGNSEIMTGPSYFDVFKYDWLAGSAQSLRQPFMVVLSESEAQKFFGPGKAADYLGRRLIYQDSLQVTVSGIVKDRTFHTDFPYKNFISISSATHSFVKNNIPTEDWTSLGPHRSYAFVKLAPGIKPEKINALFGEYIKKNVKPDPFFGTISMYLEPITHIHFMPNFHRDDDGDNQFRKAYLPVLYGLIGVAVFILLLAVMNFVNLSTAVSMQRAREVGVRKVLGSGRGGLIAQFLLETLMLTLIATGLALVLIRPVMHLFRDYIPEGVVFSFSGGTILFMMSVVAVTTICAGLYPARMLSRYQPVDTLKGNPAIKGEQRWYLRKSLIVFQFVVSFLFIIGALVIKNQIRFMHDTSKGFATDAIVVLPPDYGDHENKMSEFLKSLRSVPGIRSAIQEAFPPMGFRDMGITINYDAGNVKGLNISFQAGDEHRLPFYDIRLLAGRNLLPSDSVREVLINASCSGQLGFRRPEEAVGKIIEWDGKRFPIAGVMEDFNERSLREPIRPLLMANMKDQEHEISLKLASSGRDAAFTKNTMAAVEKKWKTFFPTNDFYYNFLDETLTWLYGPETSMAWLVNAAMIITIFISCMGIFGLALHTAERRTKEIGIRKVLGASVFSITRLLTRDFVAIVAIAFVIAAPLGWYLMNEWLNDFTFRTNIDWTVFVIAFSGALAIALMTVGTRAVKAGMSNPVEALRSE